MRRFTIYGRDLPNGEPLELAHIVKDGASWLIEVQPTGNAATTYIRDRCFTRWGAKHQAKRWLAKRTA